MKKYYLSSLVFMTVAMFFTLAFVGAGQVHAQTITLSAVTPTSFSTNDVVTFTGTGFTKSSVASYSNSPEFNFRTPGGILTPLETPTATSFQTYISVVDPTKLQVPIYMSVWDQDETGQLTIHSNTIKVTLLATNSAAPTISSISAPQGFSYGVWGSREVAISSMKVGDSVTIIGTNFNTKSTVIFDSSLVPIIPTAVSANSLTFTVPSTATPDYDGHQVQVRQSDSGFTSNGIAVVTSPPIIITSVSPSSGKPGDTITITGKNFTKEYSVSLISNDLTKGGIGYRAGCYDLKTSACNVFSTDGVTLSPFVVPQSGNGVALTGGTYTLRVGSVTRNFNSNTINFTVIAPPGIYSEVKAPCQTTGCTNTPPIITPTIPVASTPTISGGCSNGNIFNTQTGLPCVNTIVAGNKITYNFGTVTLRNGSRGNAVMELQKFLNDKEGLGLVVDGKLGPKTIAVIKKWQNDHGLVADGLIGVKTKAQMNLEAESN